MTRAYDLRLIHIGKTALGLDDDAYRDMLQAVTGKRSAADLTDKERLKVLAHMRRCGFSDRRPEIVVPPIVRKVRAMWHQLADAGIVKDRSVAAMMNWCREHQKLGAHATYAKLTAADAAPLIEAMKQWLAREVTAQAIERARRPLDGTRV